MRPVGLVQAVAEAGCDQLPVRGGQTGREPGDLREVVDRVGHRHRRRQRLARRRGTHRPVRDHQHRLQLRRHLDPAHIRPVADHETAEQRRSDVVRMAFDLGREREQIPRPVRGEVLRREQPRDDAGGARTHAAAQRDRRGDSELEAVGGQQPLKGTNYQVAAIAPDVHVGEQPELARLLHLDRQEHTERGGQHVEAGT